MESKRIINSCLMFLLISMNLCSGSRLSYLGKNTPVKTIKSKDGDVIDCLDVSNQPAIDHPLLKNNDVQEKPTNSITQSWHLDGSCPDGTIAIRRTTQEEMSRANSIPKTKGSSFQTALSNPELSSFAAGGGFRQYATASVSGDKYYGAKALINLWAPSVRPNEVSSSQLWVVGGSDSDTNVILAGWHVFPELYGDHRTRFYTYWTGDNYESTGCYNLQCQGFVQTSNKFALGAPFPELSNIDGLQVEFSVTIFKGQAGWFLQLNEFILGYWPFSLFSSLNNNPASSIQWGGMVFNSQIDGKESTTTQMGSGQFPDEGIRRASYMRQLQIVDENFILRGLDSPTALASQPNCYNIELANDLNWGDYILFGGPGRNPNCP